MSAQIWKENGVKKSRIIDRNTVYGSILKRAMEI
jgi:hypothetical protein